MKNKKTLLTTLILFLVLIEASTLFLMYKSYSGKETNLDEVNLQENLTNEMFAIMLEQDDGTYKESSDNTWPTSGYTYNASMSGCIDVNGNKLDGVLTYDATNNIATVDTGNTSYCYLYFSLPIPAFAVYSADDTSLTFYKNKDKVTAGEQYKGKAVSAVYTGVETSNYTKYNEVPWYSYATTITNVVVAEEIEPISTAWWFRMFKNTTSFDLEKLNTSKVTNMSSMFASAGSNVATYSLYLSDWDTSNVTNMADMFLNTTLSLGDLSTKTIIKEDGTTYTAWDVSGVTNMAGMFQNVGGNSSSFELDLSSWDTSNVTSMNSMFNKTGQKATTFKLNLSNWNTSSVTSMYYMFSYAGYSASTFEIKGLSTWNTSNVNSMSNMFECAGSNATTFNLDLSNWNTLNVTDMGSMFFDTGKEATTWSVGNISKWNTSNVTDMSYMFRYAGRNATYTLDLSSWDVSKVTDHEGFNLYVTSKVIAPTWAS